MRQMTLSSDPAAEAVYARLPKRLRQVLAAVVSMRRVAQEGMIAELLSPDEKLQLARVAAIEMKSVNPTLDPGDPGPGGRWTGVNVLPMGLRLMNVAIREFVPGKPETGYLDIFELRDGRPATHRYPRGAIARPGLT